MLLIFFSAILIFNIIYKTIVTDIQHFNPLNTRTRII